VKEKHEDASFRDDSFLLHLNIAKHKQPIKKGTKEDEGKRAREKESGRRRRSVAVAVAVAVKK